MCKKYASFAVCVILIMLAAGCRTHSKTPADKTSAKYDNSDYTLQNVTLNVSATGRGATRQNAKDLAFNNAKRDIVDTITAIVNRIAAMRNFPVQDHIQFTLPALRHVKYDYSRQWETIVFICSASVSLLAVADEMYSALKAPPEYGYCQFLRDVDLVTGMQKP